METSTLLTAAGAIILSGITWWVNTIWADMKQLKNELAEFKTQVARDCVAKADLEKIIDRVFNKLDELSKELNHIARNQGQAKILAEALQTRQDRTDREDRTLRSDRSK